MKKIMYGQDARMEILQGVQIIAKAVKVTLGPSGRNVLISNKAEKRPFSTKDGVTVAGQIEDVNPIIQAAIESVQDVANSADASAGDGTTTATILAESILEQGVKFPDELNLLTIKKGIDAAVKLVVDVLKENAIDCQDDEEVLHQAALIASNYDKESADIVLKAFKVAGKQGVVNIKRSRTYETYMTTIKGMTLPIGYKSNYYITDYENDICEFDNPYVYLTNKKIDRLTTNFDALLNQVNEKEGALLIICQDMETNISDMLIQNKMNAGFKVCVCKAPEFGTQQIEILKDLGAVLGKEPFLENEGIDFDSIPAEELLNHIPQSEAIAVGANQTSIKGAYGTDEELEVIEQKKKARATKLRTTLEGYVNEFERSQMQIRISRLTDGIAYINIGAVSDTEFIEKQARIQDSLYAVKSANEEGVIPGGGAALYSISKMELEHKNKNESFQYGIDIVINAIQAPFNQIMKNVGTVLSEGDLNKIKNNFHTGYDAKNGVMVKSMIKAGIVDPVKVTRVALENAASISGMLLTTECVIVDEKENNPPQPQY